MKPASNNARKSKYLLTRHKPDRLAFVNMQFCLALAVGFVMGFTLSYMAVSGSLKLTIPNSATVQSIENVSMHSKDEGFHKMENSTVADLLYERVRVLCLILTYPKNHKVKARHVKATWGRRCNILLFMSSAKDKSLPTVALNVTEGRNNLWNKTRESFKYVYRNYLDKADWFLKADDDTYVIVENLRYLLMDYNTSEPIYFGCRFKPHAMDGYMSGGAGYVLSRNAVERFAETSLKSFTSCKETLTSSEDINMGMCMSDAQVKAGDSRDPLGRGRFFPLQTKTHLIPGMLPPWYNQYIFYDGESGMKCCSDSAISFHYIEPSQMYLLEYLIYHLRPYGVSLHFPMPPMSTEKPAVVGINHSTNDSNMVKNLDKFLPVSFFTSLT